MVGTGTSSTIGNIAFLRTLLQGEALQEYDLIIVTFRGTAATHQQEIRKVILEYFFPINTIEKQKRTMRHMMRKPRRVKLKHFAARLQEWINLLTKFLLSEDSWKIPQKELNKILLNGLPHEWAEQAMLLGFDFESEPFRAALELF